MFDFASLRVFVAAAECRSFSLAAINLGVAQPTVSRVIKELEAAWGEPLFYRTGRGVELSEFGEMAFGRARDLLVHGEQVMVDLRETNRRPVGQVTIGVPPSLVGSVIPELAQGLGSEEPGIKLRVREGFSDQIDRWVQDGSVEIGLVSKYREAEHAVEGEFFCSPLILARIRNDQPMPPTIDFSELEGKLLVLPIPPNGLRLAVGAVARRLRIALNVFVDAESIVAQKLVAEKCGCYMIKAAYSLDLEHDSQFDRSLIVNPQIWRAVTMRTTQTRPLNKATRAVAERIKGVLRAFPASM
jgi:DNA-binding transcriptional LysR family regulator